MTTPFHPRATAAILAALAVAFEGCSSNGSCETSALCEKDSFCFDGACVASLPAGNFTTPGARSIVYGGEISATSSTCPTFPATADPIETFPAGWVQDFPTPATVGEAVAFEVPEGTASVTIHLQAEIAATQVDFYNPSYGSDYNYVIPARIELPNGDVLYEYSDALTSPKDPTFTGGYFAPNPWTATFTVPSTHRLADLALARGSLPAGTWKVTPADYLSRCDLFGGCVPDTVGEYRVTVVTKPGPYVASGSLDVAVYFVSATVDASTASTSASYQRFVDGIDRLLGGAGVYVNTVRFFEIPHSVASGYYSTDVSDTPPCGQLSQLFALARPATPTSPGLDGVRIFLVDDLVAGSSNVVGLTGSIPGPTGLPGAVTSGIIMSLQQIDDVLRNPSTGAPSGPCGTGFDLYCDADASAYVAAHEIGHWLGLYHPTEATGELYDPLTDTATCGCDSCGWGCPAFTGVSASMCAAEEGSCSGGRNLMFWQVDPDVSRGDLTREQGLVMRANPAVKWEIP